MYAQVHAKGFRVSRGEADPLADDFSPIWSCKMSEKIAVSIPEAAKMLGLGRSSIYKLFEQGKLTKRKSGTRALVLVSELKAFAESLPEAA